MTGRALLLRGDARALPLADASVDLIVTSPPFHKLRSYTDNGRHYDAQIGSEATLAAFLEQLWLVTAECVRVMKPTASLFVELGDSYTGKGLNLAPHRYAIGCVDRLGLLLRAEIVWHHVNGLPESVRDRVRRSHSVWFHFVRQPKYYAAVDEIREPHLNTGGGRGDYAKSVDRAAAAAGMPIHCQLAWTNGHPLGKLPGSVWSIASEPLQVPDHLGIDHYAAFPSEWPRRLILGWSPPAICRVCGHGRWPVVERSEDESYRHAPRNDVSHQQQGAYGSGMDRPGSPVIRQQATILGYACACTPYTDHPGTGHVYDRQETRYADHLAEGGCPRTGYSTELHARPKVGPWREYHLTGWTPPPSRPAVVLDCFGGTGTTAMVARALGRHAISLDLSADYCRLATWRVFHSGAAGKAVARTNRERQGALL